MYGHKRVFMIGWIWFAVCSIICGFGYATPHIVFFSICRAFQGIGPALLIPNAIALLGRNFSVGTQRNIAFACFGAAGPTGATAGAVFTALIADLYWWPWCFWILSFACLGACGAAYLIIPGEITQEKSFQRQHFDFPGAITGVVGLLLVNFTLNQAPLVGWTMWYIPAMLVLGLAFLVAFVVIELHFTEHPLIPIRGLGTEAYFALGCIAAGWGSHGIWAYYLYLFVGSHACDCSNKC
jgi:MFS family permease